MFYLHASPVTSDLNLDILAPDAVYKHRNWSRDHNLTCLQNKTCPDLLFGQVHLEILGYEGGCTSAKTDVSLWHSYYTLADVWATIDKTDISMMHYACTSGKNHTRTQQLSDSDILKCVSRTSKIFLNIIIKSFPYSKWI